MTAHPDASKSSSKKSLGRPSGRGAQWKRQSPFTQAEPQRRVLRPAVERLGARRERRKRGSGRLAVLGEDGGVFPVGCGVGLPEAGGSGGTDCRHGRDAGCTARPPHGITRDVRIGASASGQYCPPADDAGQVALFVENLDRIGHQPNASSCRAGTGRPLASPENRIQHRRRRDHPSRPPLGPGRGRKVNLCRRPGQPPRLVQTLT